MLKFDLIWSHVAVVTLANFMLGWAWFSPLLFVKPWMRAMGKDPNKKPTKEQMKEMPKLMAGALLTSFLFSAGTAVLVLSLNATDAGQGALIGTFLGLVFVASHQLGTAFEGRKGMVILISSGHGLAALVLDGAIHGAWR